MNADIYNLKARSLDKIIGAGLLEKAGFTWKKIPFLHYMIFNRGNHYLWKSECEIHLHKLRVGFPAVIIIAEDIMDEIHGISLLKIIEILSKSHDVIVFSSYNISRETDAIKGVIFITGSSLSNSNINDIVLEELKFLEKEKKVIHYVLTNSIECNHILRYISQKPLCIIGLIPNCIITRGNIDKILNLHLLSSYQIYFDEKLRSKALSGYPLEAGFQSVIYNEGNDAPEDNSKLLVSYIEKIAKSQKAKNVSLIESCRIIEATDEINWNYACPSSKDNLPILVIQYLRGWNSGIQMRKPFPGFHPKIYNDHQKQKNLNPVANFIKNGMPGGPWLSQVITPCTKSTFSNMKSRARVALHLHLHYLDHAEKILGSIGKTNNEISLYISTSSIDNKEIINKLIDKYSLNCSALKIFPNRGRDIGPFLTGFGKDLSQNYDIIGHIHSKKSLHATQVDSDAWCLFLLENVIGTKTSMIDLIVDNMREDKSLGIVYPDDPIVHGWGKNYAYAAQLLSRMSLVVPQENLGFNFPAGNMFWARTAALKPIFDLDLQWDDYPREPVGVDGTMLHAIERLFGIIPGIYGYRTAVTYVDSVTR